MKLSISLTTALLTSLVLTAGCSSGTVPSEAPTVTETVTATPTAAAEVAVEPAAPGPVGGIGVVDDPQVMADALAQAGDIYCTGLEDPEDFETKSVSNMTGTWSCEGHGLINLWPNEVEAGRGIPMLVLAMQGVTDERDHPSELVLGPNWAYFTPAPDDGVKAQAVLGGVLVKLEPGMSPQEMIGDINGGQVAEASEVTVTETAEVTVTVTAEPEKRKSASSFGDGTHVVGEDIEAGTYRADPSDMCYWARLSGLSGELDDIITNDIASGAAVVEISSSDVAFESSGCGTWEKVG